MKDLFKNRTLIITGVGRSGTTLLGKIIGSMDPVFYLFEPALTKYIASFPYSEIFTKILFEDYFLGLVHGRGNHNPHDWSFVGNHELMCEVYNRQKTLRRRSDALEYISRVNPLWAIKNPEFQHLMDFAHSHFKGVRFLHILRNGIDVVRSSMERGWYTDKYCNEDIVEETYRFNSINVPHFIANATDRQFWHEINPMTRAACAWRHLTEQGISYKRKNKDSVIQFRYEDFCKQPERFSKYISEKLGLRMTALTKQHIGKVFSKPSDDPELNLMDIEQPERSKFLRLNEKLGYV